MNKIKSVFNWIVLSSADPSKISLTLKSGIPLIALFLGWAHYGQSFDQGAANNFVDACVAAADIVGKLLLSVTTAYGLGRKVVLSIKPDPTN